MKNLIATPNKMTNSATKTSLSTFGLIAGLGSLFMLTSPFAEFMVYDKLVVTGNAAETCKTFWHIKHSSQPVY